MTEPSAGVNTSKLFSQAAPTQRPPMRLCLGFASHVPTFELTAGPEAWAEPCPLALPSPLPAERAWRLDLGLRTEVRVWGAIVFIELKTIFAFERDGFHRLVR